MPFDVLNNPLNERQRNKQACYSVERLWKTLDMKSDMWLATQAVTYLSGFCLFQAAWSCVIVM